MGQAATQHCLCGHWRAHAAATAVAQPVLVTSVGMPITPANAISTAETHFDGYKGVKSNDPCLSSIEELMLFLNTHNSRPYLAMRVHGYHTELRHRNVEYTDSDGNRRTRREAYHHTVTDFDYKVDLSSFIFPVGFIQSVESHGADIPSSFPSISLIPTTL